MFQMEREMIVHLALDPFQAFFQVPEFIGAHPLHPTPEEEPQRQDDGPQEVQDQSEPLGDHREKSCKEGGVDLSGRRVESLASSCRHMRLMNALMDENAFADPNQEWSNDRVQRPMRSFPQSLLLSITAAAPTRKPDQSQDRQPRLLPTRDSQLPIGPVHSV